MLYCERCMLLCGESECPGCGAKRLRTPQENDPVYLLEKEAIWSGGIEEILREGGIPCLRQGIQGAAITAKMGEVTETYRFYVPYGAYERSKGLLANLFNDEG